MRRLIRLPPSPLAPHTRSSPPAPDAAGEAPLPMSTRVSRIAAERWGRPGLNLGFCGDRVPSPHPRQPADRGAPRPAAGRGIGFRISSVRMRTIRAAMRRGRVQVTGQPPRLGTCFRFSRVPISRSRARVAAKKRPRGRPVRRRSSRAAAARRWCAGGRGSRPARGRGWPCPRERAADCVVDQEQVAAQREPFDHSLPCRIDLHVASIPKCPCMTHDRFINNILTYLTGLHYVI